MSKHLNFHYIILCTFIISLVVSTFAEMHLDLEGEVQADGGMNETVTRNKVCLKYQVTTLLCNYITKPKPNLLHF